MNLNSYMVLLYVLSLQCLKACLWNFSREMELYIQGNSKIINTRLIDPDKLNFSCDRLFQFSRPLV